MSSRTVRNAIASDSAALRRIGHGYLTGRGEISAASGQLITIRVMDAHTPDAVDASSSQRPTEFRGRTASLIEFCDT